jgi:hypothetical protein
MQVSMLLSDTGTSVVGASTPSAARDGLANGLRERPRSRFLAARGRSRRK